MCKKLFKLSLILLHMLLGFTATASATTLNLPNDLSVIEEEAFYGVQSFDAVELPGNILRIESKALTYGHYVLSTDLQYM